MSDIYFATFKDPLLTAVRKDRQDILHTCAIRAMNVRTHKMKGITALLPTSTSLLPSYERNMGVGNLRDKLSVITTSSGGFPLK
jgi:hypothetical protein